MRRRRQRDEKARLFGLYPKCLFFFFFSAPVLWLATTAFSPLSLRRVCTCMYLTPAHRFLIFRACVAFLSVDLLKEHIGHKGGSEILISLLKSRDLELQQAAAKLLRSISVNERNRDRLARDGAISVLVKAIATTEDFTLKLAATASLWNLSVNGT